MLIQSQSGRIILEVLVATAIFGVSTAGTISGIALSYRQVSQTFSRLKAQSKKAINPTNSNCIAIQLPSGLAGIKCNRSDGTFSFFTR